MRAAGFFERMRTQMQLGYAVGLHKMNYGESTWLAMQVHSSQSYAGLPPLQYLTALKRHLKRYLTTV